MREAVEIDMPDRQSHFGRGIALDKGEAGAGRFGRKAKPFQNAARHRCLDRAKVDAQRHDIARAQAAGEPSADCATRHLAGKRDHVGLLSRGMASVKAVHRPPSEWNPYVTTCGLKSHKQSER